MDSNDKPPYRHWHVVCAACNKITFARCGNVPRKIEPVGHNPVIECQHCKDFGQYLASECFLARWLLDWRKRLPRLPWSLA
jgi:hypothetical protein